MLYLRNSLCFAIAAIMRCFYSQDFELSLPSGHPFPMDKFRVSKDMLLDGGILRPEEIIEVRAADSHHGRAPVHPGA